MTNHGLRKIVFLAALLTIVFATAPSRTAAQVPAGQVIPGKYIVLLAEGADPEDVAQQHGLAAGQTSLPNHPLKVVSGPWEIGTI